MHDSLTVTYRRPSDLRPHPRNARIHNRKQRRQIEASISRFGFVNPILIDGMDQVLAGHGRLLAAQQLGLEAVPTIRIEGLSAAQARAYMLADNKLTENAGWDREILAVELDELVELLPLDGLDIGITGFEPPEIDLILADHTETRPAPADRPFLVPDIATARRGELWLLGGHRVLCGDARSIEDVQRLMDGERARTTFTDPPYNVRIAGHVQGRHGKVRHAEFAMASGEMSDAAFEAFLRDSLVRIRDVSRDGATAYVCMDWRHIGVLDRVGREVFSDLKNLVVWNKTSPGQGSFYRSQHELIFVFKVGEGAPINTFGLGATGRMRSNVWTYPGVNSFGAGRGEALAMHPTVKPLALVLDALRDSTLKGDIVLDLFGGSGTTLLAAEKIGRRARVMELEPRYVDVTIARWQAYTKAEAVLADDGRTFAEVRAERLAGRDEEALAAPVAQSRRAQP